MVDSLMLTVTVTTSPTLSVLFKAPVAPLIATEVTVGFTVSVATTPDVDEVLELPAAATPNTPSANTAGKTDAVATDAPTAAVVTLAVVAVAAVASAAAAA